LAYTTFPIGLGGNVAAWIANRANEDLARRYHGSDRSRIHYLCHDCGTLSRGAQAPRWGWIV